MFPSISAKPWRISRHAAFVWTCALALGLLAGCGKQLPAGDAAAASAPGVLLAASAPSAAASAPAVPSTFYGTAFERQPQPNELTDLGRVLFAETALSGSGQLACVSCHSPAHAYGPPNDLSVQIGGSDLKQPGLRAVPSLTYGQDTPPFSEHFSDTDGNDSEDLGPTGGRDWDGRASSVHEQAAGPLLSSFEMAGVDAASVVQRLAASPTAASFKAAFGEHVFDDRDKAWKGLLLALEVFQQSPSEFYPYTSKYDAYLRQQAQLSDAEKRGLLVFNDMNKGNCASCHISNIKRGVFPQFTDRGLIAIGVPRNPKIPANRDPHYNDLGLCGPIRTDLQDHPEYCGLFKTPSLRNVAVRHAFFHNGGMHTLEEVLDFYAERDVNPGRFYPRGKDGKVRKFDDLPAAYLENLNDDPPFDRHPGDKPSMTKEERKDVIAFLKTLTDGYVVPAASATPGGPEVKASPR